MSDLGQWLREAREARGLSLAEVEEATHIRQQFLSALEADEWASLPNEAVGRGFLRNYALFLGLDAEALLAQRQAEVASDQALATASLEPRPVDYRPIDFDLRLPADGAFPWRRWGITALVIALLALGAWWTITYQPDLLAALGPQPTATPTVTPTALPTELPTATPAPTVVTPAPTPTSRVFVLPTPIPSPTPTELASPTPTTAAASPGVRVTTRIVERSWLRVVVDGQVQLETILEAGDEREWLGQQSVTVRCGNAGGTVIILDGQELGAMGAPGQVVERTWAWLDGRIVELEPTITAQKKETGGSLEPIVPLTPTPPPTPTPAG